MVPHEHDEDMELNGQAVGQPVPQHHGWTRGKVLLLAGVCAVLAACIAIIAIGAAQDAAEDTSSAVIQLENTTEGQKN